MLRGSTAQVAQLLHATRAITINSQGQTLFFFFFSVEGIIKPYNLIIYLLKIIKNYIYYVDISVSYKFKKFRWSFFFHLKSDRNLYKFINKIKCLNLNIFF